MIDQIAGTQADIERQLSELRQPANGRADPALISQLSSRLTALNALRQTVGSVAAADLAQLQAVVSAQVAASDAGIAQANGMMSDTPDGNAGYQAATAALDRKVAPLLALDASHNNEAHDMARSEGVDLSAFDAERDDLRKQRDRAVASGDKVGERQADWLMAQNTYNAMVAVGDGITDPAARARYDQEIAEQKKTADDLRLAYIEQLEAKAQQKAQDQHLPPSVVADYVTDNIARADARAATLHADDHQGSGQSRFAIGRAEGAGHGDAIGASARTGELHTRNA